MKEIIEQLAGQFGLGEGQVEGAAGSLLNLVKEHLPSADFQALTDKLPGAQDLMAKAGSVADSAQDTGGSLLGQAASLLGGVQGAGQGGIAALLGQLDKSGISADTAMQLLPALLEKLKGVIGPDLVERISTAVPGLKGGLGSGAGNLLGGLFK